MLHLYYYSILYTKNTLILFHLENNNIYNKLKFSLPVKNIEHFEGYLKNDNDSWHEMNT